MVRRRRKVILIVDDNATHRAPVREHLELDGYKVVEAASEEEATRRFNEDHPDLAIVDMVLKENAAIPNFSGIRWIASLPEDFPVIVLSGHYNPEMVREALAGRKNVATYLKKQESMETLRANVKVALLKSRTRPALRLRVMLVLIFGGSSAALCYYFLGDFLLALAAAIIVGGLVEVGRLFF